MATENLFNAKYLSDREIWRRINTIMNKQNHTKKQLSKPAISTDPNKLPSLAKQLEHLNQFCIPVGELKENINDLQELEKMLTYTPEDTELIELKEEYLNICREIAGEIYNLLLKNGYLEEEIEDDIDHDILKFIEFAGPEYAWRLGINLGLDETTARYRLEVLLKKGLLKRVEGTLLHNYHRQKDWSKHMNHTYYQLSRKAKLYLRQLRRNSQDQ